MVVVVVVVVVVVEDVREVEAGRARFRGDAE
jgi:hypothetical protein